MPIGPKKKECLIELAGSARQNSPRYAGEPVPPLAPITVPDVALAGLGGGSRWLGEAYEPGACSPGSPDSIFEGITATKGYVGFWNRGAPFGSPSTANGNRTQFRVLR